MDQQNTNTNSEQKKENEKQIVNPIVPDGTPHPKYPNLIPFKKGQSGNPSGKPKGTPTSKNVLRKWLATKERRRNPTTGEIEELTQLDIIALALIDKARKGSAPHASLIFDRIDGKPHQSITQETAQRIIARIADDNELVQDIEEIMDENDQQNKTQSSSDESYSIDVDV